MLSTQPFSLIVSDFISLIFPNYCSACNLTLTRSEELLCTHCHSDLSLTQTHKNQPNILHSRFFEIPDLQYAMSLCWYQKGSVIQKLLHQLKYNGNEEIGVYLGEMYGKELLQEEYNKKFDLITTVPLHFVKHKKRGYNQSDKIAEGLSKALNIPFRRLLQKQVNRKSQTKKHRLERFDNVESTFSMLKNVTTDLTRKRVLVVDDVLTTGATIQAACQPLIEKGAKISILTIAVAK